MFPLILSHGPSFTVILALVKSCCPTLPCRLFNNQASVKGYVSKQPQPTLNMLVN